MLQLGFPTNYPSLGPLCLDIISGSLICLWPASSREEEVPSPLQISQYSWVAMA